MPPNLGGFMKKIIFLGVLSVLLLSSAAQAREFNLKFSPGWGYLWLLNDQAFNIRKFPDLMLNLEGAVEATRHLYPMIEVMYAHSSQKNKWFAGGLDMIGIGFGLKALVKPADYDPETGDILDRARYWFSVAPGPYITMIASNTGGNDAGVTKVRFGIDVGAGIEYYFSSHWGVGGQVKMIYVGYSDDYFILNIGPSLCARF